MGIGTDNPGTSLHIQDVYTTPYPYNAPVAGFLGAVKYPQELVLENAVAGVNGSWTGIMFRSGANSSGSAHGNARVSAVQTADNQADLTFSTKSGTFGERLRITGAGLVGIGTTVPTQKLHAFGSGDQAILIQTTDTGSSKLQLKTSQRTWNVENVTGGTFRVRDGSINSTRLSIDSAGEVGIQTSSPATILHVYGSSGTTPSFLLESATYKSYIGTIQTSGLSLIHI